MAENKTVGLGSGSRVPTNRRETLPPEVGGDQGPSFPLPHPADGEGPFQCDWVLKRSQFNSCLKS